MSVPSVFPYYQWCPPLLTNLICRHLNFIYFPCPIYIMWLFLCSKLVEFLLTVDGDPTAQILLSSLYNPTYVTQHSNPNPPSRRLDQPLLHCLHLPRRHQGCSWCRRGPLWLPPLVQVRNLIPPPHTFSCATPPPLWLPSLIFPSQVAARSATYHHPPYSLLSGVGSSGKGQLLPGKLEHWPISVGGDAAGEGECIEVEQSRDRSPWCETDTADRSGQRRSRAQISKKNSKVWNSTNPLPLIIPPFKRIPDWDLDLYMKKIRYATVWSDIRHEMHITLWTTRHPYSWQLKLETLPKRQAVISLLWNGAPCSIIWWKRK